MQSSVRRQAAADLMEIQENDFYKLFAWCTTTLLLINHNCSFAVQHFAVSKAIKTLSSTERVYTQRLRSDRDGKQTDAVLDLLLCVGGR